MAGIIDGIKIEPKARSENDKPLSYPVKSLGSDINIPQPASDVNGNVAQVPTKKLITYHAPKWDEQRRIDENNSTVYSVLRCVTEIALLKNTV